MRKKSTVGDWPEVLFSTRESSARVSRALERGELRHLGPRLYTTRLDLELAEVLRKHWRTVVAGYFPGSVIGFRTALEGKPTRDGEVFITAGTRRSVELEGLRISAVEGPGALEGDMPLPDAEGPFQALDGVIGALLGTRDVQVSSPTARARIAGAPVDTDRLDTLDVLHECLAGLMLPAPPDPAPSGRAARHLAFLHAYFSNYIEGTEFQIDEARAIVFEGKVVPARVDDTHDIVGTFDLVSDPAFVRRGSASRPDPDDFLTALQAANRRIMRGRPGKRPTDSPAAPGDVRADAPVRPTGDESRLLR